MKLEIANLLSEFNSDIEVREDYSGRGMFGKTTAGVVCDFNELLNAFGLIMTDGNSEEKELLGYFLCDCSLSEDSMGMKNIFY